MDNNSLGLIKMKGSSYTISPERFFQMSIGMIPIYRLIKCNVIGFVVCLDHDCRYWLIIKDKKGNFCRHPFAKNDAWWKALTTEPEFIGFLDLPQIYLTGLG